MPRMLKRFRGPLLFLMLLSVTARIFTGASEAQVNFTSLIVDQHLAYQSAMHPIAHDHHEVLKSAENASSIPDKHRTYATYKKYITPDKSFAVEITRSHDPSAAHDRIAYVGAAFLHTSIYLPVSNSPPVGVFAHSLTQTSTADSSVVLENYFGEIEINNSAGGLGSFQL